MSDRPECGHGDHDWDALSFRCLKCSANGATSRRPVKAGGLRLEIDAAEFDQIDQYRSAVMLGGYESRIEFRAPDGQLKEWGAALGGKFRITIEELGEP